MSGPLHGLKVLEIAGIGPGPFAGMLLADMGADVLRIDRPGGTMSAAPAEFDLLNRGKRSLTIDIKSSPAEVLDLVGQSDVLFEGFRPGVAERLGIGPDACLARNPKLVYGRITGWGQDGPRSQTAGHDINYLAITGALHATGAAGKPTFPMNMLGDFAGGSLYLVIGILAALREGRGQVVDAAIVDGVSHLMAMTWSMYAAGSWTDARESNLLDGGAAFYDTYETSDSRHVAIGPLEPRFFAEMMTRLGLDPELRASTELRDQLTAVFKTRTQAEWTDLFADTDACVTPVLSLSQAADDPHLKARGTYVHKDGMIQPAPAPRFS